MLMTTPEKDEYVSLVAVLAGETAEDRIERFVQHVYAEAGVPTGLPVADVLRLERRMTSIIGRYDFSDAARTAKRAGAAVAAIRQELAVPNHTNEQNTEGNTMSEQPTPATSPLRRRVKDTTPEVVENKPKPERKPRKAKAEKVPEQKAEQPKATAPAEQTTLSFRAVSEQTGVALSTLTKLKASGEVADHLDGDGKFLASIVDYLKANPPAKARRGRPAKAEGGEKPARAPRKPRTVREAAQELARQGAGEGHEAGLILHHASRVEKAFTRRDWSGFKRELAALESAMQTARGEAMREAFEAL